MYTQVHYCNSINISSELNNSNLLSFQPVYMRYEFAIIHTKISQTRSTHPCNPSVSQCCIKLTSNEPLHFACLLYRSAEQRSVPSHNNSTLLKLFWLGACLGNSAGSLSVSLMLDVQPFTFTAHSSIFLLFLLLNMKVSGTCPTLHIWLLWKTAFPLLNNHMALICHSWQLNFILLMS